MVIWISRESAIRPVVDEKQSFYAVKVETLDPNIAAAALGMEADIRAYHRYLVALAGEVKKPPQQQNIEGLEVPECLRPVGPLSDELHSEPDTEAPSSKASPTQRKKKASSSSTSRKKAG